MKLRLALCFFTASCAMSGCSTTLPTVDCTSNLDANLLTRSYDYPAKLEEGTTFSDALKQSGFEKSELASCSVTVKALQQTLKGCSKAVRAIQ